MANSPHGENPFLDQRALLVALHDFAGTKLYATDTGRLKEVLTGDFIKNFVKFGKSGKSRV